MQYCPSNSSTYLSACSAKLTHLMFFLGWRLPCFSAGCSLIEVPFNFIFPDGSYDDLLNDTDVQCVYVGNLHVFRRDIGEKCLTAGKHVLLEKPFAISTEDAAYLIQLAKEKNLFIMEVRSLNDWLSFCVCGKTKSKTAYLHITLSSI